MKTILTTIISSLLIISNLNSQELNINTKKASVKFEFISEQTEGTVSGLEAKIILNTDDLSKSSIEGSVDVTTLTTSNSMRDKHLQKSDMFDAKKHPKMTFKSSSFVQTELGIKAKGTVRIKGKEKETDFLFKSTKTGLVGTMIVYTNDFNVFPKAKRSDSKVKIKISLPFK